MIWLRPGAGIAAALLILSLTGCTAEPWTLSRSRDAITLRWYSDATREVQAQGVAGAYCTEVGKSVELGAIARDGSAVVAQYRCV